MHADEFDPNDLGVLYLLIYSSPTLKKVAVHCTGVVESRLRFTQLLSRLGLQQSPIQLPEFSFKFCKALSLCLSRSSTLQVVELHGIHFDAKGMRYLAKGIGQSSVLKHLDLKGCKIGDKGLFALAGFSSLLKGTTRMKEPVEHSNSPGPGLATSTSLQILALSACNLTDVGINYICSVIKAHGTRRENQLWSHSLRSQSQARAHVHMSGLLLIDLQGNNFTSTGCRSLSRVLGTDEWLLGINIAKNKNVSSKTVREWQDWMKEKMAAFRTLRDANCIISDSEKVDLQSTFKQWGEGESSSTADLARGELEIQSTERSFFKQGNDICKGTLQLHDPMCEVATLPPQVQEQTRRTKCCGPGTESAKKSKRVGGAQCTTKVSPPSPSKQKSVSRKTSRSSSSGKGLGGHESGEKKGAAGKKAGKGSTKSASKPQSKTSLDLYESSSTHEDEVSANASTASFAQPVGMAPSTVDAAPSSVNVTTLTRLQLQNKALIQKLNASNLEVERLRSCMTAIKDNVEEKAAGKAITQFNVSGNNIEDVLKFFETELETLVRQVDTFEMVMAGGNPPPQKKREMLNTIEVSDDIGEALAVRMSELWGSSEDGKPVEDLRLEIGKALSIRMHELWNGD